MRQSAVSTVSLTSWVIASRLPGPMPTIRTRGRTVQPNRSHSTSSTAVKGRPSRWGGRPMTTRPAPDFRAADTLAGKPPASPPSLVTIHAASANRSVAKSISSEKGPCMAMIWAAVSPAARQASSEASIGSTRAYTRWAKSGMALYAASSLLPVVSRIWPCVRARNAAAAAAFSTQTTSSVCWEDCRSRRRYSVSVSRQAVEMLSVMEVA